MADKTALDIVDLTIDLERQSEPLSAGTHLIILDDVDVDEGPSGYPFLRVTYKALEGPEAGKEVQDIISLSPAARFRVDAWLDAMLMPKEGSARPAAFIGKTLRAEVTHEEYDGRVRARPKRYLPDLRHAPAPSQPGGSADFSKMPPVPPSPVPRPARSIGQAIKAEE
jgi:hypothetical protein